MSGLERTLSHINDEEETFDEEVTMEDGPQKKDIEARGTSS